MESLHYELKPFNIKVKIIEPGAVNTRLTENTVASQSSMMEDYAPYVERVKKNLLSSNGYRPFWQCPPGGGIRLHTTSDERRPVTTRSFGASYSAARARRPLGTDRPGSAKRALDVPDWHNLAGRVL
jgi:NAD(P)-dependent dehydrogenase (short-subunit alcohol dehydrogenase family)